MVYTIASRVQEYLTCEVVKMHNDVGSQDSVHRDATDLGLSLDMSPV
jgi:hypothetical protein